MANLEEITEKYELVQSPQWKKIREIELNHIVKLSAGNLDPLIIIGMLRNINSIDKWEEDFISKKKEQNKE